jgi:hypothetical protein
MIKDREMDRDLTTMRRGELRVVDGKLWGRCEDCGKTRHVGLLGGLHLCIDLADRS